MAKPILPDALWARVAPLLPPQPPKPKGGRPRVSDRAALTGILLVLKSGIPWEMLPRELDCGSGMTGWRRLRDWQTAGVWQRLHAQLLRELRECDQIEGSRVAVDTATVPAPRGARRRGPTRPTGANWGSNATSRSTPAACRWR